VCLCVVCHLIPIYIQWNLSLTKISCTETLFKVRFIHDDYPVIMVTFIWPHIYWPSKIIYSFEDFDDLTDLWSSLVMIFHYTTHSKIFTSQILSIHHSQKHSREIMRFVSGVCLCVVCHLIPIYIQWNCISCTETLSKVRFIHDDYLVMVRFRKVSK
jgi:hypothetical protein